MDKTKYAVLTDSTCDIPQTLVQEYGIDMLHFKIALDGESYEERVDFTPSAYCEMLRSAKGIPTTSQLNVYEFEEKFNAYDDAGVETVLYVSINSKGSATHQNAQQAKAAFYENRPDSAMRIFIVDSHCYSMTYGVHVVEAARRLREGQTMEDVVAYLNDIFTRMETVLTVYSLKIVRKSGRVSAAAAVAGDVLGIHPVFTLNGGVSKVVKKVRGNKAVCQSACRYVKEHIKEGAPYYLGISNPEYVQEYEQELTQMLGYPPAMRFELGAAVLSNTGPEAIGIIYEGREARTDD